MGSGASLAKDSLSDASDAQIRSALGELSPAEWSKVHEATASGQGDAAHWVCSNFCILHEDGHLDPFVFQLLASFPG